MIPRVAVVPSGGGSPDVLRDTESVVIAEVVAAEVVVAEVVIAEVVFVGLG